MLMTISALCGIAIGLMAVVGFATKYVLLPFLRTELVAPVLARLDTTGDDLDDIRADLDKHVTEATYTVRALDQRVSALVRRA